MDEFGTRIQALEQAIDDGQIRAMLEAAQRLEDGVALKFSFVGEDECGQSVDECWRVEAAGVAEHALAFEAVLPRFTAHHPRLSSWQEDWARLMFASAPGNAEQVERDLRTAHDDWHYGPFEAVWQPSDLFFGVGQLAHGPLSLLEHYAAVLELHGMRPSLLWVGRRQPHQPAPQLMLHLDWSSSWFVESYVIAQSFQARRLPGRAVNRGL